MSAAGPPRTARTSRTAGAVRGLVLPAAESGSLEGPWDQAFWFTVEGPLRSKSNHRRGERRDRRSTWAGLASFESDLAHTARMHRPRGWDCGDPDRDLADRPRMAVVVFARSLLDTANLDKSVLDALQGPLMVNDAQAVRVSEFSERTSAHPGGLVAVARFPARCPLPVVVRAAVQLELHCLQLLEDASVPDPVHT